MQRLSANAAHNQDTLNVVVILGSGPKASQAAEWDARFWNQLVVINNAWRIRSDWDACVFPEDFPDENRPFNPASGQTLIQAGALRAATEPVWRCGLCGRHHGLYHSLLGAWRTET